MGHVERMARRSRSAAKPTTATDRFFLRASLPKARSTRENQAEPIRGQQNATANAIAVRQPSISNNEGPRSGTEDKTISELFASSVSSYNQVWRFTIRAQSPSSTSRPLFFRLCRTAVILRFLPCAQRNWL